MNIQIEHVSKTVNKTEVLKDISLCLSSGRIYGLKGKNGAGKTMLLRLICGLIVPTSGKVLIDDMQLHKDMSFPKNVGILIENPGFLRDHTGYKNLEILASIKGVAQKQTITELMDYFDLDSSSKKKVRAYSLGMKQKLGIIAALMEDPNLILLDEPLNALDDLSSEKLKQVLIERKQAGALIIVASHDIEVLESLADEIIEIKNGSIFNSNL